MQTVAEESVTTTAQAPYGAGATPSRRKILGFRVPWPVYQALRRYCDDTGLKQQTVLERALEAYLRERQAL